MMVRWLITVVDDGRGIARGVARPPARPPERADTTTDDESANDEWRASS
jgi:hypothetical protein